MENQKTACKSASGFAKQMCMNSKNFKEMASRHDIQQIDNEIHGLLNKYTHSEIEQVKILHSLISLRYIKNIELTYFI